MKVGDLIHMPGQYCQSSDDVPSIGIVIDDDVITTRDDPRGGKGRIGVMWVDNWGSVDFEPKKWLEVLSEAIPLEA